MAVLEDLLALVLENSSISAEFECLETINAIYEPGFQINVDTSALTNVGLVGVTQLVPTGINIQLVDKSTGSDDDSILDINNNCPQVANFDQSVLDGDGIGDACDSDIDNDGFANAFDCGATNVDIHPGAIEIINDGIDQDCNNYDLTIHVSKAVYSEKSDKLRITATSALGANAQLTIKGYGRMKWKKGKSIWRSRLKKTGGNPGYVTISGLEGSVTVLVTQ